MVDEFKSLRDNIFKVLGNLSASREDGGDDACLDDLDEDDERGRGRGGLDASAARALIGAFFARAGKGKDEVVQIIAREIGVAVAAMLKEPLSQLAQHQKLQISFEFVPKDGKATSAFRASDIKVEARMTKRADKAPARKTAAPRKKRRRAGSSG